MTESTRPDDDETLSERESIRAEFDWSEVTPSLAIIETVAIAVDREPTELEPLFGTIDPDALDAIICSTGTDSPANDATVSFALDGCQITVERTGSVVVRPDETPGS